MEVFGRFSVRKNDPGYDSYIAQGGHNPSWKITVDGVEILQVISVDTEAGIVIANELNEHGRAFVRDHAVAEREITGKVRVFVGNNSES